jgi:hypothetical protein
LIFNRTADLIWNRELLQQKRGGMRGKSMTSGFALVLLLFSASAFFGASQGNIGPGLKSGKSKLSKSEREKTKKPAPRPNRPPELVGSKEQRIAQNLRAIELGLNQIQIETELKELAQNGTLVELTDTECYYVDRSVIKRLRLPKSKKIRTEKETKPVFVYPWAKAYLEKVAGDYSKKFHKRWRVTSGARSLWFHHEMTRKGSPYYTPFAAKAESPLEESLHTRGNTFDISRRGMSLKEIKWMRNRLIADKKNGVEFEIENQEEMEQERAGQEEAGKNDKILIKPEPVEERICYHIVVFPGQKKIQ